MWRRKPNVNWAMSLMMTATCSWKLGPLIFHISVSGLDFCRERAVERKPVLPEKGKQSVYTDTSYAYRQASEGSAVASIARFARRFCLDRDVEARLDREVTAIQPRFKVSTTPPQQLFTHLSTSSPHSECFSPQQRKTQFNTPNDQLCAAEQQQRYDQAVTRARVS